MVAVAALLVLGVLASKVSDRLGVPALLLFLVVGMLAGSEGIGGIDFSNVALAQDVGVVALAFILFAGGLDTQWAAVRPVLKRALLLATFGVLFTAVVVGVVTAGGGRGVARWGVGVALSVGLVAGAIVASTGGAAVVAVLGSHSVSLK